MRRIKMALQTVCTPKCIRCETKTMASNDEAYGIELSSTFNQFLKDQTKKKRTQIERKKKHTLQKPSNLIRCLFRFGNFLRRRSNRIWFIRNVNSPKNIPNLCKYSKNVRMVSSFVGFDLVSLHNIASIVVCSVECECKQKQKKRKKRTAALVD